MYSSVHRIGWCECAGPWVAGKGHIKPIPEGLIGTGEAQAVSAERRL
jgi:hypothetical protein